MKVKRTNCVYGYLSIGNVHWFGSRMSKKSKIKNSEQGIKLTPVLLFKDGEQDERRMLGKNSP